MKWTVVLFFALFAPFGQCMPAPVEESTLCKLLSQEPCIYDDKFRKQCPLKCDIVLHKLFGEAVGATTSTAEVSVTNHGSCIHLSASDCDGLHAEVVKKNCPAMCADIFAGFLDEEVTLAPTEEVSVTNHGSCIHLVASDCVGQHAEVVKKNCPIMCAAVTPAPTEDAVTPAPTEEVTNFPSCVHLMLHDCWGKHEKVVKLNCPKMCASVMGNTLEANRTRESYQAPVWASVSLGDEPHSIEPPSIQEPITPIATEKETKIKTIILVINPAKPQ